VRDLGSGWVETIDLGWRPWEVDRNLVVADAFIPPRQSPAGCLFHHGMFGILASEGAYIVDAREVGDGGKQHFVAGVVAQEPSTTETGYLLQVLGDIGFVMVLVVVGCPS
jgi:hypothetical protein